VSFSIPRLIIAGTGGDSGKTLVSLGLLAAWRGQGLHPAAFKKGPDYIDAAWLGWAAGTPCRNLDTFLQPPEKLLATLCEHASDEVNVIEGNRGLLDGFDLQGTHSTASLARLLRAPVVLVVSAAKVTRTVAAVVLGCLKLEPELQLAGVILNRVSGPRHERVVRQAVEELTGVPVVGVLPRIVEQFLPGRHLGLVPPQEHQQAAEAAGRLGDLVGKNVDLGRLLHVAQEAPALPLSDLSPPAALPPADLSPSDQPAVRIGVFWDSAFTFYYPENLEALEQAGAELVRISGLQDPLLPPDLDALYLGGGFPETHAAKLSQNESLRGQLHEAAEAGLPIYAECGGLIYLSQSLRIGEERFPMAGVLPLDLELCPKPAGHGYVELVVDQDNPFFDEGQILTGHEFHYTRIEGPTPSPGIVGSSPAEVYTAFEVRRGTGCGAGRDGIVYKNVLAAYTHLHAVGVPEWARSLVQRARH